MPPIATLQWRELSGRLRRRQVTGALLQVGSIRFQMSSPDVFFVTFGEVDSVFLCLCGDEGFIQY